MGGFYRQLPKRKPVTGRELAEARAFYKLTQTALGERWGVTRATVSNWEHGTPPRWVADAVAGWRRNWT